MAASMALQVVVSPFIGVLFDNLSSLIQKNVGLIWGVDKEMKKLASILSTIHDVLADAEEKQITEKAVANWLLKLRDLAFDADDILDEWGTEARELLIETEHVTRSNQDISKAKNQHKFVKGPQIFSSSLGDPYSMHIFPYQHMLASLSIVIDHILCSFSDGCTQLGEAPDSTMCVITMIEQLLDLRYELYSQVLAYQNKLLLSKLWSTIVLRRNLPRRKRRINKEVFESAPEGLTEVASHFQEHRMYSTGPLEVLGSRRYDATFNTAVEAARGYDAEVGDQGHSIRLDTQD